MADMTRTIQTTCPHCDATVECEVIRRPATVEFKGRSYHGVEEFVRCGACGEDFDMLGLQDPLQLAYDSYRKEHGFPTAVQIADLRRDMGLDEQQFAAVLNTSKTTVKLYERGALPSDEHGELLAKLCAVHRILTPLA